MSFGTAKISLSCDVFVSACTGSEGGLLGAERAQGRSTLLDLDKSRTGKEKYTKRLR